MSTPGNTAFAGTTTDLYDTRSELLQEKSTRNGGYTASFGFDLAGNLTTFWGTSHTFNSDDEITDASFTYDGDGNPIDYHGSAMGYDPENRLIGVGTGACGY